MVKLGIIVQAHMGSTRLPRKMVKDLCGKPVLEHVLTRLKKVTAADELIVATSTLKADDEIAAIGKHMKVKVYRGSDKDVLARFYEAATEYQLTDVARACADNTLIDYEIIDSELRAYKEGKGKIVIASKNIPLGLGVEVFSYEMLKNAYEHATENYQHEHVTPYIYENYGNPYLLSYPHDYSKYRFTLDTADDFKLIEKIYSALYHGKHDFVLQDIAAVMEKNKEWLNINSHVHQKGVKE